MACTRQQLLQKITDYLSSTPDCGLVDPLELLEIAMRSRELVCYDLIEELTQKPKLTREEIVEIITKKLLDITAE